MSKLVTIERWKCECCGKLYDEEEEADECCALTDEEKLQHCAGCEDNFYNGNNPLGVKRCWGLATAKLIMRKRVHINQRPPWDQKAEPYLDCYKEKRYIFVGPNQIG